MKKKMSEFNAEWRACMKEITENGGAVFSNKALRKYFKQHYCKNPKDKSYIDIVDIYGQIVSQGVYYAKGYRLERGGYFFTHAGFIADELSITTRRVRELIGVLVEYGLIEKKKVPGYANRYKINPGKLTELTKEITFKYRNARNGNVNENEEYEEEEQQYVEIRTF
jgi:hypothetical protein